MLKYRNINKLIIFCIFAILIFSCGKKNDYKVYSDTLDGPFDTTHIVSGQFKNEVEFYNVSQIYKTEMERLNKLFNAYTNYNNINNIKTINDNAGIKPVKVDSKIIDLVLYAKKLNLEINDSVNIAFGPVINEWESKMKLSNVLELPTDSILKDKNKCTNIQNIIVDKNNKTIFLKDKCMKLNVGAIAKGYAVELISKKIIENGVDSFIISAGGNIKVIGKRHILKKDSEVKDLPLCKTMFCVGVATPLYNNEILDKKNIYNKYEYIAKIAVEDTSIVTTGDYQRYFLYKNNVYNHVINPKTLKPANNFRSVTVITNDSGCADFLSTTLFILSYEKGLNVVNELNKKGIKVDAIWAFENGDIKYTERLKNEKNSIFNISK